MDKIVITGVPPYDGEYEVDLSSLTNGELRLIKQVSGLRAGELAEAAAAADNDLLVAFTEIALLRAGKPVDRGILWDASAGAIVYAAEGEEDAAVPPGEAAESDSGGSEKRQSSGGHSGSTSESQVSPLRPTGGHGSESGSGSGQETLAS